MIGRAIALQLLKNNEVFQSKVEDLQVSFFILLFHYLAVLRQLALWETWHKMTKSFCHFVPSDQKGKYFTVHMNLEW